MNTVDSAFNPAICPKCGLAMERNTNPMRVPDIWLQCSWCGHTVEETPDEYAGRSPTPPWVSPEKWRDFLLARQQWACPECGGKGFNVVASVQGFDLAHVPTGTVTVNAHTVEPELRNEKCLNCEGTGYLKRKE